MPIELSDDQTGRLLAGLAAAEEALAIMAAAGATAAHGFAEVTAVLDELRAAKGQGPLRKADLNRAQRRAKKKAGQQP